MKQVVALLFLSLAMSGVSAAAPSAEAASAPESVNLSSFQQQRRLIEAGLTGETYREISRTDRETVLEALDRMEDALASVESAAALPPEKQVELFNDQELVNTLLTKAERDSRIRCERRQRAGTHFRQANCQTLAERARRREADQAALRSLQDTRMPSGE